MRADPVTEISAIMRIICIRVKYSNREFLVLAIILAKTKNRNNNNQK